MFSELPIIKRFQAWDHHLLLNRPRLWALRPLSLAAYVVFFNLLSVVLCLLVPVRPYNAHRFSLWLWILGLVEVLVVALWLRRVSQFSPEKALENTSPLRGPLEILLYALCILLILSPTLVGGSMLQVRIANLVPEAEIAQHWERVRDNYPLSDQVFSQTIVEKYSQIGYEDYLILSESEKVKVNREISDVVGKIYDATTQDDYDWENYLFVSIAITHLGALLFQIQHHRNGMAGWGVLYAAGLFLGLLIVTGIFIALLDYFWPDLSYSWDDPGIFLPDIPGLGMMLFVLLMSLSPLWQKSHKLFTALNTIILPYVIYLGLLYLFERYSWDMGLYRLVRSLDGYWPELIIFILFGSPLFIAILSVGTKAIYMKMLTQPEN